MDKLTDPCACFQKQHFPRREKARARTLLLISSLLAGSAPLHAHATDTDDAARCDIKINTDRGKGGLQASNCTSNGEPGGSVGFSGTLDDVTWQTPFGGRYAFFPNLGPSLGDLFSNAPIAVGKGIGDGSVAVSTGVRDGATAVAVAAQQTVTAVSVAAQQTVAATTVAVQQTVAATAVAAKQASTGVHDAAGWAGDRIGVHWHF